VRSRVRPVAVTWASGVLLSLPLAACVDGDLPPRPTAALTCADAGAPTQLASAPDCGGMNLVVANDTVYWTEKAGGTVKSVPTCGGPITTLASGQTSPGALAVDATWIFWVNGKTIMRKALAGGTPTIFVAATTDTEVFGDENDINALLVHDGTLFFGRYIYAVGIPTSGGMRTVLGASPDADRGRPGAFAIDATHLYQTELSHGAISRESLDGKQMGLLKDGVSRADKAPDRIAVSQDPMVTDAIAVVDGDVLWATKNKIASKPVGALEGETFDPLAELDLPARVVGGPPDPKVTGFVVSGGSIYLGESPHDNIQKVPFSTPVPFQADAGAGPVPTVIATGQMAPSQLAADAVNIYWRTADCKIMKLAK
jgi:hypothetical protein